MDIHYMNALKSAKKLLGSGIKEPMSLEEIALLENKHTEGNEFPKAFREYLFLAGKYGGTGVVNEDWDDIRKTCDGDMEYCGYSLDRPYFVFDYLDGQASIFFLDEDNEDPVCYILDPYGKKEGEYDLVRPMFLSSFKALIEEAIHRIKTDTPF
jgi:hypothetical protein